MGILGKLKMKKEDEPTEATTAKKPVAKKSVASEKTETVEVVADKTKKSKASAVSYKVLRYPLITEKSAVMESANKYSFIVDSKANKISIKQAVKELYGVVPLNVSTINVSGKQKGQGRSAGRRSDYKKAIVTLPKGKSITVHEGV